MKTLLTLILIAFFFKMIAIVCYFFIELVDEYDKRYHAIFYITNGINFILWFIVSVWCFGITFLNWRVF